RWGSWPISFRGIVQGLRFGSLLDALQLLSPVPLERAGPLVQWLDSRRIRSIQLAPSLASHPHQAHVAKHTQVLRNRRLGQGQSSNEVGDRTLLGGEKLEDDAALRLGNRIEHIGPGSSARHSGYYILIWECVKRIVSDGGCQEERAASRARRDRLD